jgi:hypothetical protein
MQTDLHQQLNNSFRGLGRFIWEQRTFVEDPERARRKPESFSRLPGNAYRLPGRDLLLQINPPGSSVNVFQELARVVLMQNNASGLPVSLSRSRNRVAGVPVKANGPRQEPSSSWTRCALRPTEVARRPLDELPSRQTHPGIRSGTTRRPTRLRRHNLEPQSNEVGRVRRNMWRHRGNAEGFRDGVGILSHKRSRSGYGSRGSDSQSSRTSPGIRPNSRVL